MACVKEECEKFIVMNSMFGLKTEDEELMEEIGASQTANSETTAFYTGDSAPSRVDHENFQMKVLMKLDTIIENQEEILRNQRLLLSANTEDEEDIIERPCETLEDLQALEKELEDKLRRKKMTNFLRSLGGANLNAAVRKMLRRVGNNSLWAKFSLRGRLGKFPFEKLKLCGAMIGACHKLFPNITMDKVEDAIGKALKLEPHRQLKW